MTNYEVKITARTAEETKANFVEMTTRVFTPSPASILREYNMTEDDCYRNYRSRREKHYRRRASQQTMLFIRIRPSKP